MTSEVPLKLRESLPTPPPTVALCIETVNVRLSLPLRRRCWSHLRQLHDDNVIAIIASNDVGAALAVDSVVAERATIESAPDVPIRVLAIGPEDRVVASAHWKRIKWWVSCWDSHNRTTKGAVCA